MTLPWGMFGENLTTEGLLEDVLRIGDRFRIGTTEVREKVRKSEHVSSFHLAPADGQPLPPYLPDQYVTVRLAIPGVERPVVRSYSLSDVTRSDRYRLTIRRIGPRPGEPHAKARLVSTYFHDGLAVGDTIEVKAPAGAFTIDLRQQNRPVVLIGGFEANTAAPFRSRMVAGTCTFNLTDSGSSMRLISRKPKRSCWH
jgi:hypothetical protein